MQYHLIFDMDGVLVDSEPFHQSVLQSVCDRIGIRIDKPYYTTLVGMGDLQLWSKLIDDFDLDKSPDWYISFHKKLLYEALPSADVTPMPYVLDLIEELAAHNFRLSLGSSSPVKVINTFVEKLKIVSYFDHLVSREHVSQGKPHPDIFLEVARRYGLPPEEFLVIEDSYNGVCAATSAGMRSVGYIHPNSGKQDLSNAVMVIDSFSCISAQRLKEMYTCKK
ncbi:HAD family phosphatase [Ascidiimonas aurantiaca]|uniref:HAD family hydrolase n=1 Tax=Ascidiimonas aurantiaca TaxID=1685432 RepID=UPI0030EBF726